MEVDFQSQTVENLDTLIPLKNLNVLKEATKKLELKLFRFLSQYFKLNHLIVHTSTFSFLIDEILHFLIIAIGLWEIQKNHLSLINLITFEMLLGYFLEPFKNIISLLPDYNCMKVNLEKTNEFYTLELEDNQIGFSEFQTGNIEVKNFSFSYNKFRPLLENVNVMIKENSFVLFKGKSGSGKSTLCQILSRLVETKNSNITIGGINIHDYSLSTICQNITYVGQKENLIQETIRQNILFYREIEESEFQKISKICHIEEIVYKKPFRYETFLLKDSLNLSGGEKQRIILARALLNSSKILILDEALSEVNEDLEIDIIKNLHLYFADKTIIYVSHKNLDPYFDQVVNFEAFRER